jgi:glycosyltransferase involved in cell wall biosynthesis
VLNDEIRSELQAMAGHGLPIVSIPNGVDMERFHIMDPSDKARLAPPHMEAGASLFVFAGQLIDRKGISPLLEAWRRWHPRRPKRLWIIGKGPREDMVKRHAAADPTIFFQPARPDLENIIPLADVFVLPTQKEAQSNAAAEALASGVILMAGPCGLEAHLGPEPKGIIPLDPDGLEESLLQAFEAWEEGGGPPFSPKEVRSQMEPLAISKIASRWIALYEQWI